MIYPLLELADNNEALWVDVTVSAGLGAKIASVQTMLDGFELAADLLKPSQGSYQRVWRQVGTAQIGATHEVVVNAVDEQGNQETGSRLGRISGESRRRNGCSGDELLP
jgi:hypothetical protein